MGSSLATRPRPQVRGLRGGAAVGLLRAVAAAAATYFLLGELLPYDIRLAARRVGVAARWQVQEVALIVALSCLFLLLGTTPKAGAHGKGPPWLVVDAPKALAVANILPLAASTMTPLFARVSDNCPLSERALRLLSLELDSLGLVSARAARLDLGLVLLASSRSSRSWLLATTGGRVGFAEAVEGHRAAGWWCVVQSALHSVAYLLFYLVEGGGWRAVWRYCFPVPLASKTNGVNTLGLVNFFGVVAFGIALALALAAIERIRRRHFEIFQMLHLPLAALFVLGCALHDLPILLFACPGLADWFFGWRYDEGAAERRLPARARVLEGTSWVEVTVTIASDATGGGWDAAADATPSAAPMGRWVRLRFPGLLGRESHPFSVASMTRTELSVLVSARGGDWTKKLAALADQVEAADVCGPYSFGAEEWALAGRCLEREEETSLLLIAGGTGISGWLEGEMALACHRLVWCVQTVADYQALAPRLPSHARVFITRGASAGGGKIGPPRQAPEPRQGGGGVGGGEGMVLSSRSSNFPSVSLAAAIVGLAVQEGFWWGWVIPRLPAASRHHWTTYILVHRCLPIIIIIITMAATTGLGSRLAAALRRRVHRRQRRWQYEKVGNGECEALGGDASIAELGGETVSTRGRRSWLKQPDVRFGRPDLCEMVQKMVAEVRGHDATAGGVRKRLVVSACGPMVMVEAAEKAVEAVRDAPDFERMRVRLEFFGLDSRW